MQSGTEKRAALAFARSQGWLPPEEMPTKMPFPSVTTTELSTLVHPRVQQLEDRVAEIEGRRLDTETALTAERESHAVTKAALLRSRGKGAGQRIAALEGALVDAVWAVGEVAAGGTNDKVRAAVACAEALLK